MKKVVGLAVLFAAGLLAAGALTAVGVADVTTTETLSATTTIEQTTTEPATTVVSTVEQTTTRRVPVPATTGTTSETSSSSSTPTWVWVVLAILAAAVIGLLVAVFTRGGGGISGVERQRRLEAAVASWSAQGWALENQTPGSAILRRGPEVMVVSVDDKGQVSTRPAAG
ncbi:MAG TPA: hypothetical protein VHS03_00525 [Gaiellaceae bacterium]|jgi:hypothetical protein|nr:hypothetical protein [Gaiellaceae bacterium]